ncbi:hypothetical protein CK203_066997 [Vitis vinifera]|uniref:Uncharacterized protein n=1 Tax=Vitis vinifera TaxID=29760 RepID=A0A438F585_VITVI|nr:hypothetical protein CK203_066997 [Vitis vinifera]
MDRFRGLTFSTAWFLFFFFIIIIIIFYPQSLCSDNVADGQGGQNNVETNKDEKPSTLVMLTDTLALLSRSRDIAQSRMGEGDGPGGRMKEAAEESTKSAVAAVEESANQQLRWWKKQCK